MNNFAVFAFALLAVGTVVAHDWCTGCHYSLAGVGFMEHHYCRAYIRCEENPYNEDGYNYHVMCCAKGLMWDQDTLTCIRGTDHDHCTPGPDDKDDICPPIPDTNDGPCPPHVYFIECAPGTAFNEDICACDHIYNYLAPACDKLIHFNFDDDFHSRACNNFVHGEKHGYPKLEDSALFLNGDKSFLEFNFFNNWFAENPAADTMTISAWVKPDGDWEGGFPILVHGDCHEGASFVMAIYGSAFAYYGKVGAGSPDAFNAFDDWTHLAAVYDGEKMELYINCVPVASNLLKDASYNIQTSTVIGFLFGNVYKGYIDDVCVWSTALSQGAIEDMCVAGRSVQV